MVGLRSKDRNKMVDPETFKWHPPKNNQGMRYEDLSKSTKNLADKIDMLCPESSEKHIAINKLREALMWANSAIAIHE